MFSLDFSGAWAELCLSQDGSSSRASMEIRTTTRERAQSRWEGILGKVSIVVWSDRAVGRKMLGECKARSACKAFHTVTFEPSLLLWTD